MRNVYILSPHIDDAAYSLAITIGRCIQQNFSVTVLNCFTKTNWAMKFISKDLNEISRHRKNEDIAFYKKYGHPIQIINLDLTDAPLREGYFWKTKPFTFLEKQLIDRLELELLELRPDLLFVPLAIGNHIDHEICISAAKRLYRTVPILFFEDLPYAQRITEDAIQAHVHALEAGLQTTLSCKVIAPGCCPFDKSDAITMYDSQLNAEILGEISARMQSIKGERIWGEQEILGYL